MIMDHLPALQVVIPLLAAPICFLLPSNRLAGLFAILVSWVSFIIAIQLVIATNSGDVLHYSFGGWEPPWGIDYSVDTLNSYVLLIVSGIAAVVFPYSLTSIKREIPESHHRLFFTSMLLCLAGLLGGYLVESWVTTHLQLGVFYLIIGAGMGGVLWSSARMNKKADNAEVEFS